MPPIVELPPPPGPPRAGINVLGPHRPVEIRSPEALERYSLPELAERLRDVVDWDRQFLLLFAWRGPSDDRLEYTMAESFPERVVFTYDRGAASDRRLHIRLFLLRRDVMWTAPTVHLPSDPVPHMGN